MTRVLITGVNGFVGHHLTEELVSHGFTVVGMGREAQTTLEQPGFDYVSADLTRPWPGPATVGPVDAVIHLAGLSSVGPSFDDPQTYIDVNSSIVIRMAEWVREFASSARGVIVSTGAVYESDPNKLIDEQSPLDASSPHVVSKLLVENMVSFYRHIGLKWLIARPFNHIGPGQGGGFLLPDLEAGIRRAQETGGGVGAGDLDVARDYTDVRDVVRAYRMLLSLEGDDEWIYNVCSGVPRTGKDVLAALFRALDIPPIPVVTDPAQARPTNARSIAGSFSRLQHATGWAPTISLDRCVADFVADRRLSRSEPE